MFLFLCTKLFQKRGHYSRGDIIQGRTLFKEIRYNTELDFKITLTSSEGLQVQLRNPLYDKYLVHHHLSHHYRMVIYVVSSEPFQFFSVKRKGCLYTHSVHAVNFHEFSIINNFICPKCRGKSNT